jgi:hypothetical protein
MRLARRLALPMTGVRDGCSSIASIPTILVSTVY